MLISCVVYKFSCYLSTSFCIILHKAFKFVNINNDQGETW